MFIVIRIDACVYIEYIQVYVYLWYYVCTVHVLSTSKSCESSFSSHWPVSVQGSDIKITSFASKLDHPAKWWSHFSVPSSVQDTWGDFLGQSAHHLRFSSFKLYLCTYTVSWHCVRCQNESKVCYGSRKLECSADRENIHEWVLVMTDNYSVQVLQGSCTSGAKFCDMSNNILSLCKACYFVVQLLCIFYVFDRFVVLVRTMKQ